MILLGLMMAAVKVSYAAVGDFSAISVRQLLTQCLKQNESLYLAPSSCDLYIAGFIAATRQFDVSDQFCSSEQNSLELAPIRDEFIQWAINHSEEYDATAASALVTVMNSLYPCDNSSTVPQ